MYWNIIKILNDLGIEYKEIEHPASHTCDESKAFREEKWLSGLGSKNIVFHCKGEFYLVTTHWDKSIKARNFKIEFWSKDIRFATQDEISGIGLWIIWSISPFWFENDNIRIFVDSEIFENEFFIFNPAVPTKSIQIKTSDLKRVYGNLKNEIKFFIHNEEKFEIF